MRRFILILILATIGVSGCGTAEPSFEEVYSRALRGDASAQYMLAQIYMNDSEAKYNPVEGARWLRASAEKGFAKAQREIGGLYSRGGGGFPKNRVESARWYQKAADQGDIEAQCILGKRYVMGDGVPKDFQEAVKLLRKAAEAGHASAQYSLGLRYSRGEGTDVDDEKAVYWFRRSAAQGYSASQVLLANRCIDGEGTKKDLAEAYKWLAIAADNNEHDAKEQCAVITKKMTFAEIATGKGRAKKFVVKLEYDPLKQNSSSNCILWVGAFVSVGFYLTVFYLIWRKRKGDIHSSKNSMKIPQPSAASAKSFSAFTLIELLVVVTTIAVLAGLILTSISRSKQKAYQTYCASNLKQIGTALAMYINESRTLPGPCFQGVSRHYCIRMRNFEKFGQKRTLGPTELIGYLAPYLGLPSPPLAPRYATGMVAVCPGFEQFAPNPPPRPAFEGYSYMCNRVVTNVLKGTFSDSSTSEVFSNIFGYMDGKFVVNCLPRRFEEIRAPSSTWAIMDADKSAISYAPWRINLPSKRVHGTVWNRLYFDSHVGSTKQLR